jgi:hypothetical protein
MPNDHVGALSGVTYRIPDLDDNADVEVAFTQFADTLPAAPKALSYLTVTGNVNPAAVNNMYISEATGPITITLPPGTHEGDKVVGYQLGNPGTEVTLVGQPGAPYQGPPSTTGQYTAVTAIWHIDPDTGNGKWVGSPFSFSGDRPTSSTGGEIVDLNGYRYHIFKEPGSFTFVSDRNQLLTVTTIGGGGPGVAGSTTAAGDGGYGGQVTIQPGYEVFGLDFVPVVVPVAGGDAQFGSLTAPGGPGGVPGTPTPGTPPTPITGDLATVLGATQAGGDGGNAVGPVNGGIGQGGGGGYLMKTQIGRPSHVESGTNPQYWVETRPAWSETVQTGTNHVTHHGDPCQGTYMDACPPGWYCVQAGQPNNWCETQTDEPVYSTVNHPAEGYWAGGGSWSNTVWDACPAGYTVGGDGTICVDSRPSGGGQGGPGAVIVSYPIPE